MLLPSGPRPPTHLPPDPAAPAQATRPGHRLALPALRYPDPLGGSETPTPLGGPGQGRPGTPARWPSPAPPAQGESSYVGGVGGAARAAGGDLRPRAVVGGAGRGRRCPRRSRCPRKGAACSSPRWARSRSPRCRGPPPSPPPRWCRAPEGPPWGAGSAPAAGRRGAVLRELPPSHSSLPSPGSHPRARPDLGDLRGLSGSFHWLPGGGGLPAGAVWVLVVGVLIVVSLALALSIRVLRGNPGMRTQGRQGREGTAAQEPRCPPPTPAAGRRARTADPRPQRAAARGRRPGHAPGAHSPGGSCSGRWGSEDLLCCADGPRRPLLGRLRAAPPPPDSAPGVPAAVWSQAGGHREASRPH